MKYVGSKNRLSKKIAPIIQSYITNDTNGYLEPFVGGANMIDKIVCSVKYGCDIHPQLIALLKYVQNLDNNLPKYISENEYIAVRDNKESYPDWYVGLVGFSASFGAKYFGGYARSFKNDKITPRNMSNEAIRNIEKQRKNLQNIIFENKSFLDINTNIHDWVIYCDIPYKQTLKYNTVDFPYDKFYQWCDLMGKNNIMLISEYSMPPEFKCIWEKESKVGINQGEHKRRIEKLFKLSNN